MGTHRCCWTLRYGQLWPTKGAVIAESQPSQTVPTTLKAPMAWWKKDSGKRRFTGEPSHKTHLKAAPHAVPSYSFVLAALECGHQQSKIVTKNKPVQQLCKEQLQGLPGEQTPTRIPLWHTNCYYIEHERHQCEPPSLLFTATNTQSSKNIGSLQRHFFTEEKYIFHRLCNLWFRYLHLRATDFSLHLY